MSDWIPVDVVPRTSGDAPTAAVALPGEFTSVHTARRFTERLLRRWGLERFCEDAQLIVSELVTNALRHANVRGEPEPDPLSTDGVWAWPRPIRLALACTDEGVTCLVADTSSREPVARHFDGLMPGGRGLHIVAALSREWGTTPLARGGKVVWARLGD
ncbi:MAG: ATP-binding protein [Streptosporangiales bacterium]|nr:ATP-binding protein [Streptosporangiales bacterium]